MVWSSVVCVADTSLSLRAAYSASLPTSPKHRATQSLIDPKRKSSASSHKNIKIPRAVPALHRIPRRHHKPARAKADSLRRCSREALSYGTVRRRPCFPATTCVVCIKSNILTNLDEDVLDVLRALRRGFHVDKPVVLRVLTRFFRLYLPGSIRRKGGRRDRNL